jgi:lysophospholipase L1-like esterase
LSRFDADVVDQAGVTDVIIMLGLNDLGGGAQSPELIAGLTELVQRAKAAGINPLLGTLTPVSTSVFFRDQSEINDWIRSQDLAPVVDFERAVADPGHPRRLLPAYDGGDHAHLSAAGYERMADEVDLAAFQGRVCASRRAGAPAG